MKSFKIIPPNHLDYLKSFFFWNENGIPHCVKEIKPTFFTKGYLIVTVEDEEFGQELHDKVAKRFNTAQHNPKDTQ